MKILTSDTVRILSGKDKGKTGKVLRALPKLGRVLVEKVNVITKHIKKTEQRPGQKVQFEKPIDVCRVALLCPNCDKPTRVGYTTLENGKKARVCKKCGKGVPNQKISKK